MTKAKKKKKNKKKNSHQQNIETSYEQSTLCWMYNKNPHQKEVTSDSLASKQAYEQLPP